MGDFRYCVGTFTRSASSNVTDTVTGIADSQGPFTPKGLILWSNVHTVTGVTDWGEFAFGFTDGTNMKTSAQHVPDNVALVGTFAAGTAYQNDAAMFSVSQVFDAASIGVAPFFPTPVFANGQFSVRWIDNTVIFPWLIHYIAIGGDDLSVAVGTIPNPVGTGPQSYSITDLAGKQVTGLIAMNVIRMNGVSSQPVFHQSNIPVLGWGDRDGNQGALGAHGGYTSPTSMTTIQLTDSIIAMLPGDATLGAPNNQASLTSLDVGGFTLNWSATIGNGVYGDAGTHYLAISGPRVVAGHLAQPATTGLVPITAPIAPGAALFLSRGAAASGVYGTPYSVSFGCVGVNGNSTAQAAGWSSSRDGVDPSQAAGAVFTDKVLTMQTVVNPGGTTVVNAEAVANLTSLGIGLDWTTADATPREVLYLLFEGGNFSPPPNPPASGITTPIPIRRLRRSPHVVASQKRVFWKRLQIDFQPGIGTPTGQGADPQVMLRWSDDGGDHYGNEHWERIGGTGETLVRAQWFLMGSARDRVLELVVTDPVTPWCVIDGYADLEPGSS